MEKNRKLVLLICIPILIGIFFCVGYFYSAFQEKSKIAQAELDAFIINNIIAKAANTSDPVYLNDFQGIKQGFLENKVDFIEVNLPEMSLRIWKKGELEDEFEIIKKGNPDSWGGTAAGLYKIESGFQSSYSTASEVYMPYALKFYGKYYIHGEPYYPGGAKLISDFSGGCIRLKDKDAKEVYEKSEIGMPVLVIDKLNDDYEAVLGTDFPNISAENYLIADLDSGFVFKEKDSLIKKPIASITKLLTAIVVAENVNLKKSITVRDWMLKGYGTTDHLEEGDTLRVIELFYPLLVESSNNTAEVMSYFLGRDNTIDLMNEKAKAILMPNTVFIDVSGYAPENISTAQDLFYLARYIKNNRPPIFEITRGEDVPSFGPVRLDIDEMWNKNVFSEDETFIGGKTGFIKESKYNGLFVFRFKTEDNIERNIAIILLGSQHQNSLKTDTQKIYIWLAKNYFTL